MTERQLLWNRSSDLPLTQPGPERHYWHFVIINNKDKVEPIKQKLYGLLNPIVERKEIFSSGIIGSDLYCELFCLVTSRVPDIDFSEVYDGKVRKDRRLYPRKTPNGWNDLTEKLYQGEI